MILVTRKLIIEVLFNEFIDDEWRICILKMNGFNAFYVIMKRVSIMTISIKHLIKLILYENDVNVIKCKRSLA